MANIKKIIIIDDDKSFSWILSQGFAGGGFEVVMAENGQEGLKLIESEKPDLILLDVMMPVMDGIEMAKQVKAKGITAPIIFLTNMSDADHISNAVQVVPSDYILKADVPVSQIVLQVKKRLGV